MLLSGRNLVYLQIMQVSEYPGIVEWPPMAGGAYARGDEFPMDVSTVVVERVFPVVNEFLTFTCKFKGRSHTYDLRTQDEETAKGLAFWLDKLSGLTLDKFGDFPLDL